jgi:hypothetical protein
MPSRKPSPKLKAADRSRVRSHRHNMPPLISRSPKERGSLRLGASLSSRSYFVMRASRENALLFAPDSKNSCPWGTSSSSNARPTGALPSSNAHLGTVLPGPPSTRTSLSDNWLPPDSKTGEGERAQSYRARLRHCLSYRHVLPRGRRFHNYIFFWKYLPYSRLTSPFG